MEDKLRCIHVVRVGSVQEAKLDGVGVGGVDVLFLLAAAADRQTALKVPLSDRRVHRTGRLMPAATRLVVMHNQWLRSRTLSKQNQSVVLPIGASCFTPLYAAHRPCPGDGIVLSVPS